MEVGDVGTDCGRGVSRWVDGDEDRLCNRAEFLVWVGTSELLHVIVYIQY